MIKKCAQCGMEDPDIKEGEYWKCKYCGATEWTCEDENLEISEDEYFSSIDIDGPVEKSQINLGLCICRQCPSYSFFCKVKELPINMANLVEDISKEHHVESLFCAVGKSQCIEHEKICICSECKVHKSYELTEGYYCVR